MDIPINKETSQHRPLSKSNRILIKGGITAILIGILMIGVSFVDDLVRERQTRNQSVIEEVNNRWARSQTLTGPYLFLPYNKTTIDSNNKPHVTLSHFLILPENKMVSGKITHQIRDRSIYKVLLYKAALTDQGNFILNLPKEINSAQVQWTDARICFGISDFKGIEEKMIIRFNGTDTELSPGLPAGDEEKGLSAPVVISSDVLGKSFDYKINVKIRGSENLHFLPLAGDSHFDLSSDWPSPSFDGNNLPAERTVSKTGFTASWNFNKANLPFRTVLPDFNFEKKDLAFGVSMIQPADQYAKTNRSLKYSILIIGLTFCLFFIVELMQRKPIHPVQYILIGLALVIFYSLLLAMSEFISFDWSYLIAAAATILLVGLYAKAHFRNWKPAGMFMGVLSLLYAFIFVLISLEDTVLLVGSIGLFFILALTMYASKNINWYTEPEPAYAQ